MAHASIKLTADGDQAKKAVREIREEGKKANTEIERLKKQLDALDAKFAATMGSKNFDNILKKFDKTEKKMKGLADAQNQSGRDVASRAMKDVTKELSTQETRLSKLQKQYKDINSTITKTHKEMVRVGKEASTLDKKLSKAYGTKQEWDQLRELRKQQANLRKQWKEPQAQRNLLGASVIQERQKTADPVAARISQYEKVNKEYLSARNDIEKKITDIVNASELKRAAYSKRLYEKEWANALKEYQNFLNQKENLDNQSAKLKRTFSNAFEPTDEAQRKALAQKVAAAKSKKALETEQKYLAQRGSFGPSGRSVADISALEYRNETGPKSNVSRMNDWIKDEIKQLSTLRDELENKLFDDEVYNRALKKSDYKKSTYKKDSQGGYVATMGEAQRVKTLSQIADIDKKILGFEKDITKELSSPVRKNAARTRYATRNRYDSTDAGEKKYQQYLDNLKDETHKKLDDFSKKKSVMTDKDWDNLWGTTDMTAPPDKVRQALQRLDPSLKKTAEEFKQTAKQNDQFNRTMTAASLEMQRQFKLMEKFPAVSKGYKKLEKDLHGIQRTYSALSSGSEESAKSAVKGWQEQLHGVNENRKSVEKLGKTTGIASSRLGKFSIIMSGIAASFFVFQEVSRIIAAMVGTITKMERAMNKFRVESRLSKEEMQGLSDEADKIGRSGYIAPDDYLNQIRDLEKIGISGEDARKELQGAVQREKEAGAGTLDDSIKQFVGEFRYLTKVVMTPLGNDIKSAAISLSKIAAKWADIPNLNLDSVLGTTFEASKYSELGLFKMTDFFKMEFRERQALVEDLREKLNTTTPHEDQRVKANQSNATKQYQQSVNDLWHEHKQLKSAVEDATDSIKAMDQQIDTSVRDRKFSHNVPGLDQIVQDAAKANKISTDLLWAIMKQESNFDPKAKSPKGAQGLMQLMPGTAADMGVTDITDPRQNVMGGAKYFRKMLDKYKGDQEKALAAWNWGPGHLDELGMDKRPKETLDFSKRVNENLDMLRSSTNALGTAASQAASDVVLLSDSTGKIKWEKLRGDQAQTAEWMKSNINDLKYFFNMTGKSLPGQYQVEDEQANARISNINRALKRTNMSSQQSDNILAQVGKQMEFERDQSNLEPIMRDYEATYDQIGRTSEAYWTNEYAKNENFIELLRLRNSLMKPSEQIPESDLTAIKAKMDKETKNRKIRPRLENLEDIREVTNLTAPFLKENDINKIRSKYKSMLPNLSEDERGFAKLAENSEIADISLAELGTSLESVQAHYEATGLSADRYYSLQLKYLDLVRTKQAADPNIGDKGAKEMYDASVKALDRSMVESSLKTYENMYQTTNKMTKQYLDKRLELIEMERQAYIQLTGDEISARRTAERQKEELLLEYSIKRKDRSEYGVTTGIKAGFKRYDLEKNQIALPERIADAWEKVAHDAAQTWDDTFFTFMRNEFVSLEDVALGTLRSIQSALISTLNEMIKVQTSLLFKDFMGGVNLGGGGAAGATALSNGAIANPSGVVWKMAAGGMITEPIVGIGTRSGRSYEIGEAGPEMVLPLSKMGGNGGGGGNVNIAPPGVDIIINNHSGQSATTQERSMPGGKREIMVTIGGDISGGGPTARAMERRYGLTPRGTRTYQ